MNKYLKASALLFAAVAMTGCSSLDVVRGKAVKLDNEYYYYNAQGQLEMTEDQMARLERKGLVARIKHVSMDDALVLEPSEMNLLAQDERLFFTKLSKQNDNSYLLKAGSLKKAISNIAFQLDWEGVEWQIGHDFFVESPSLIYGSDAKEIMMEALSAYPVYVVFNDRDKKVIVSQADN